MSNISIVSTKNFKYRESFEFRLQKAIVFATTENHHFHISNDTIADIVALEALAKLDYQNVTIYHLGHRAENMFAIHPKGWQTVQLNSEQERIEKLSSCENMIVVDLPMMSLQNVIKNYKGKLNVIVPGVNISSKECGIGGALSINDRFARENGKIKNKYPIKWGDKIYDCAIDLFKDKTEMNKYFLKHYKECKIDSDWLTECMFIKFVSNTYLWKSVFIRGGIDFLMNCSHYNSTPNPYQGEGLSCVYIYSLINAYEAATKYCY